MGDSHKAGEILHQGGDNNHVSQLFRLPSQRRGNKERLKRVFQQGAKRPQARRGRHTDRTLQEPLVLQPRALSRQMPRETQRGARTDAQGWKDNPRRIPHGYGEAAGPQLQALRPQRRHSNVFPRIPAPIHDGKETGKEQIPVVEPRAIQHRLAGMGDRPSVWMVQQEREEERRTIQCVYRRTENLHHPRLQDAEICRRGCAQTRGRIPPA